MTIKAGAIFALAALDGNRFAVVTSTCNALGRDCLAMFAPDGGLETKVPVARLSPNAGNWDRGATLLLRSDGTGTYVNDGVVVITDAGASDAGAVPYGARTIGAAVVGERVLLGAVPPSTAGRPVLVLGYRGNELDPSFGDAGVVELPLSLAMDNYRRSRLLSATSGGVVVSVPSSPPRAVRLRADGSLDPTFGAGGVMTLPEGTLFVRALPDGTLYASAADTVKHVLEDGKPDPSFGDGGTLEVPFVYDNFLVDSACRLVVSSGHEFRRFR